MCTRNCPEKVQWHPINLKLQKDMIKLELQSSTSAFYNVPDYLNEPDIKQYEVTAYFRNAELVEQTLDLFELNWSGVSYDMPNCAARAEGGVLFKRKGVSEYFTLRQPCLSCYIKLAQRCNDDMETLKKASVTCSLHFQPAVVVNLSSTEDGCCASVSR